MKKVRLSLVSNLLIFIFTVFATVVMFTGFKFMEGDLPLSINGLEAFKYFTVESNIMMGIIALVFFLFEIRIVRKRDKRIPTWIYDLKLIFTVGVTLTMLTTVFFLAPTTPFGYFSMFKNANLFYHFLTPVLSIITFLFFEGTNKIRFRYTFVGVVPMILYAIFYVWNVISHAENGTINIMYDWYGFFAGGTSNIICVVPIMIGSTYLISYLLWYFNRKLEFNIKL